jgi:hypothetical protein
MSRLDAKARCGLILAGGEVVRPSPLTRRSASDERSKQFCRMLGARTLTHPPAVCPVVQPQNRGTAPAILNGLLRLTAMLARGEFHRAR